MPFIVKHTLYSDYMIFSPNAKNLFRFSKIITECKVVEALLFHCEIAFTCGGNSVRLKLIIGRYTGRFLQP